MKEENPLHYKLFSLGAGIIIYFYLLLCAFLFHTENIKTTDGFCKQKTRQYTRLHKVVERPKQ